MDSFGTRDRLTGDSTGEIVLYDRWTLNREW